MDPVLVAKPAGFWVCPNHEEGTLPLPPGVAKMIKGAGSSSRGKDVVHLLPQNSVRLDFVPSPYSEFDYSEDDSDDSEASDDSESGDGSDSSGSDSSKSGGPRRSAPFRAMVKSIRKASMNGHGNGTKNENRMRGSFDSYTYLDDVCLL